MLCDAVNKKDIESSVDTCEITDGVLAVCSI